MSAVGQAIVLAVMLSDRRERSISRGATETLHFVQPAPGYALARPGGDNAATSANRPGPEAVP